MSYAVKIASLWRNFCVQKGGVAWVNWQEMVLHPSTWRVRAVRRRFCALPGREITERVSQKFDRSESKSRGFLGSSQFSFELKHNQPPNGSELRRLSRDSYLLSRAIIKDDEELWRLNCVVQRSGILFRQFWTVKWHRVKVCHKCKWKT